MESVHHIRHQNLLECKNVHDHKCLRILLQIWQIMLKPDKFQNHTEEDHGDQSVTQLS